MRTVSQIEESINDLRDELDSITSVAEKQERDMTSEESARAVEIASTLIPQEQKQLKDALAINKERQERAASRFREALEVQSSIDNNADDGRRFSSSIKVPAKAKNYGALQAFAGPDAERDAYVSGQWFLANVKGNQSAAEWCRHHGIAATLYTNTNSGAGFITLPDELMRTIVRLREERGIFPRFANAVPMGSDIIRVPRLLSDVTAYWVAEGNDVTPSDPALGSAEIMAREMAAMTKFSKALDEDAIVSIGDMVASSMAYAMSEKVDQAGFNGDGSSTYGGVLGLKNVLDSAAIITAATGNDAPNNLDIDDFLKVMGALPQYPGANNRWFMHSAVYFGACVRLMAAAGGNTIQTLANGATENMFMGYPVTFVNVMHSTITTSASTIVAYFGDLRLAATYGTRRSQQTEISTERFFESGLIAVRMTERIGINVHERGDSAFTRPILALKTAA